MVLAKEGLFFIKIMQVKKPGVNSVSQFKFEFTNEENYFLENTVKGAFEYDSNKIIALVNGSKNIRFVNRISQKEDAQLKIANISNDNDYRCMQPFPNYNYQTFPYVLIKDTKCINVINVRSMQSRVILKDSLYGWDVLRTCMMDFQTNPGSDSVTLFNLELVSRLTNPNSRVRENTSTIKKFTINLEQLDSCFM